MTRIAIDAMGGDHAPHEIVAGAVWAAQDYGVALELVGKQDRIEQELDRIAQEGIYSDCGSGGKQRRIKIDLNKLDGTWRYVKMIPRATRGGFFSASEIAVYKVNGTSGTELGDMPGTSAGIDDNDFQTINTYKGIDTSSSSWGQITDVNLNGVFDIYDYSFTLTKLDGGTTKTGKAAGNILMLTNKDTVEAGEEFTIDLYGVDLENVNAFGAVVDLGDKYDVVSIPFVSCEYHMISRKKPNFGKNEMKKGVSDV